MRNPIRGKFSATKAKAVKKIALCATLTLLVSLPQFFSVRVVLKDASQSQQNTSEFAASPSARTKSNYSFTNESDMRLQVPHPLYESFGAVSALSFAARSIVQSTILPEEDFYMYSAPESTSLSPLVTTGASLSAENESLLAEFQVSRTPDPCARQMFEEVEPIATVLRTIGYSYIGQLLFTIIPLVLLTTLNTLLVWHTLRYSRRRKSMAHAHVCFERHEPHKSSPTSATIIVKSNRQTNGTSTGGNNGTSAGGTNNLDDELDGDIVSPELHGPTRTPTRTRKGSTLSESPFAERRMSGRLHETPAMQHRISPTPNSVVVAAGSSSGNATQTEATRKRAALMASSFRRVESNVAREQHKITRMLILIVVFFLLCHLPQLIGTLWKEYVERVGLPPRSWDNARRIFGNVSNACLQINCVANFVFYSLLSTKFYSTFQSIFLGICRRRRRSSLAAMVVAGHRSTYGVAFSSLGPEHSAVAPLALGLESTTSSNQTAAASLHANSSYTLELNTHSDRHNHCHQQLLLHRPLTVRFSIPATGALQSEAEVECHTSFERLNFWVFWSIT